MGKGKQVAAVETEEVDELLNSDKATVTLEDGTSASSKSIGKANAIEGAANKAGAEADDDKDE
jgi:hypothetical protein